MLFLVFGGAALALAVASVLLPALVATLLLAVFGGYAVADAVVAVLIGLARGSRPIALLRALAGAAAGVCAGYVILVHGAFPPGAAPPRVLFAVIGAWTLASGILDLAAGLATVHGRGKALMLASGAVSAVFGVFLLGFARFSLVGELAVWVAVYAVLSGLLLLFSGVRRAGQAEAQRSSR
ncbi:MAG: DUF308 domain-containing protein [Candidatus Rokuibacteriota bacterium]